MRGSDVDSSRSAVPGEVLAEQQEYYRERAAEYDEWWERRGRYDRGAAENDQWLAEIAEVRAAFDAADFGGEVLELAGGTGNWTAYLAARAAHVTVLDGSAEMVAINRARLEREGMAERVSFERVDLFEWQSARQYDAVFFGFWLSHVPAERLERFFATVSAALRPGGTLGIIDSRREPRSSSPDQPPPPQGVDIMTRRLNDGRTFQIVKRYDEPAELAARLAAYGIQTRAATTATHFLYAVGTRGEVMGDG
jgi:demethylmenaquinone methyltransferase/2-methoxy-6-polyprenyl-1,4-benzoquinol methylase